MHPSRHSLPGPARGPVARVIASLLSAIALVVAAVLGAVVFVVALGVLAVVFAAIWLRITWWRRRLRRQGPAGSTGTGTHTGIIEGEYRVLDTTRPPGRA